MSRISSGNIRLNRRKQSVGGYRNPPTGKDVEVEKLPQSVKDRLEKSVIDEDTYLNMLYFARYQPSGRRKLNDENLSNLVIGEDEAPMTDTQGLRKGGTTSISILKNNSIKPLKTKPLNLNIKNNNRLKGNPNYTSFKNNFKM
tara:strand:+ start:4272 stop:4700 length:429 start_codon:yes stop_codon:yes gene_type:complete